MANQAQIEKTPINWAKYADTLKSFIEDKENGILLEAKDYAKGEDKENAYFELTSKKFSKEFLTIWELFDHSKPFKACIRLLSEKALEIRKERFFDLLVTSTSTAKELVNHIKPIIDDDQAVVVQYFGDYPVALAPERYYADFDGKQVLIITDIIASGTLAKDLASIVDKLNGVVVGVLAVVVTEKEVIDSYDPKKGYGIIEMERKIDIARKKHSPQLSSKKSKDLRIYSLSNRIIKYESDQDQFAPQLADVNNPRNYPEIIKINPVTVLPETDVETPFDIDSLYTRQAFFDHLKESHALDFGTFELENKFFSVVFRFQEILKHHGNTIWNKIRPSIQEVLERSNRCHPKSKPVIITSFKKEDIDFKNFVQEQLEQEGIAIDSEITVKRDTKDTPYFFFTLQSKAEKLKGKDIILVLATVSSSGKLQNISTLLATLSVRSITVICLVNRMGVYTTSFLNRIKNILSGMSVNQHNGHVQSDQLHSSITDSEKSIRKPGTDLISSKFSFQAVYDFLDIRPNDLNNAYLSIKETLLNYSSITLVPNFRRQTKQHLEYFKPNLMCPIDLTTASLTS